MAFGCGNSDLFQSWGSCFSHRIPSAQSSGKRALYISREKRQCCPTLVSLYVAQLDQQPSAVKRSQNKSAEISLYSGVCIERSGGRCFRRTCSHESKWRQAQEAQGHMTLKRDKSVLGRRASSTCHLVAWFWSIERDLFPDYLWEVLKSLKQLSNQNFSVSSKRSARMLYCNVSFDKTHCSCRCIIFMLHFIADTWLQQSLFPRCSATETARLQVHK